MGPLSCGAFLDVDMRENEANSRKVSFYATIESISLVFSPITSSPFNAEASYKWVNVTHCASINSDLR